MNQDLRGILRVVWFASDIGEHACRNGKSGWLLRSFSQCWSHGEAQEVGQAGRGLLTAQRLCAQCHAVEKGQARSPNAQAPTFPTIAAVPGMTATALSAALNTSHRSMPNILLEPDDQANIIAYILTLK